MTLVSHTVHNGPSPDRLLVLIHGRGADEHDLEPLLPYIDPQGRFTTVLPRGPFPCPPGAMWYRTLGPPRGGDGFADSVDALDDLVDAACAEHGLARGEAVVAGFSQGAMLALALGLRPPAPGMERPAGVLAMSGFLVQSDDVAYDFAGAPPVLMAHGTHDDLLDVGLARASVATLSGAGVPLVYREYPMGHQVAMEEMSDASAWLALVLDGKIPSEPAPDFAALDAPDGEDGPVRRVTTRTFEAEVLRSDLPVIVDFWAPWCGPCAMVAPVVEEIAAMRTGSYRVVKVNIDEEPSLAEAYGVQSIPMIALFRGGRMERATLGAKPRPALEAELGMLVIP